MVVNSVTPITFSSNERRIPRGHVAPKSMGMLPKATLATFLALGATGCPSGTEPKVDTIPPRTDTITSTSTATATSTATTTDTAPSKLANMWKAGHYDYDVSKGAPKTMSWFDKVGNGTINFVRADDGSDPNYLKYDVSSINGVTGADGGRGVQEYFYSPDTGELKVNAYDGSGTFKLEIDPNTGDLIYKNPTTGKPTNIQKRINKGIINDYKADDGTLHNILKDVKFDGNLVHNKGNNTKAPLVRFAEGLFRTVKPIAQEMPQKLVRYA